MFNFHKGFTLIEMLVVLAILGVLLAITGPSLSYLTKESQDAKYDASAKAIYKEICDIAIDTANKDPNDVFNTTNNPKIFELSNVNDSNVFFIFSEDPNTLTYNNVASQLTNVNTDYAIVIPIGYAEEHGNTICRFNFTKDIVIYPPNYSYKYVNGQKLPL